jgi:hypothetical protein
MLISLKALANKSRSSDNCKVWIGVPKTLTLYFFKTPVSSNWIPQLRADWPPKVKRIPSGRSLWIMYSKYSGLIGKK